MHSFLGVPIVVRDQIFGWLYLTEKLNGTEFTKDDERIALTFASQAGVAIENAHLYQEVQSRSSELVKRMSELSSVERVGDLLISGSSIDEVLRSTTGEAISLAGASLGLLLLHEEESGDLVVKHVGGSSEPPVGTRLRSGTAKAHAVLQRMKGEVVDDLTADPEVHHEILMTLGTPRSAAIVPMVVGRRALGTLAVYDRKDEKPFRLDDLAILQKPCEPGSHPPRKRAPDRGTARPGGARGTRTHCERTPRRGHPIDLLRRARASGLCLAVAQGSRPSKHAYRPSEL